MERAPFLRLRGSAFASCASATGIIIVAAALRHCRCSQVTQFINTLVADTSIAELHLQVRAARRGCSAASARWA